MQFPCFFLLAKMQKKINFQFSFYLRFEKNYGLKNCSLFSIWKKSFYFTILNINFIFLLKILVLNRVLFVYEMFNLNK